MRRLWLGLVVLLPLLLVGCASDSTADLVSYVDEIKSRYPGVVEPLPEFIPYEPFVYVVADRRDPFQSFIRQRTTDIGDDGEGLRPDFDRAREPLEEFHLDGIRLLGSMQRAGEQWAVVRDPAGDVHRVREGNYLGRNHGRIVRVEQRRIDLIEIVSDGRGQWVERPMHLVVPE